MHRTQILLEEWQYEALKGLAERRGLSLGALVREIVTESLGKAGKPWPTGPTLESIAGVAEGPSDLGERHDDYLYGDGKDEGASD